LFDLSTGTIKFSYLDEDSEVISISNDDDLKVMFSIFGKKIPKVKIDYENPFSGHVLDNIGLSSSVCFD